MINIIAQDHTLDELIKVLNKNSKIDISQARVRKLHCAEDYVFSTLVHFLDLESH